MKSGIWQAVILMSSLLAATVSLNGCALFGKGEPTRMVATLQSVQDDYHEAILEIRGAEEALHELTVSEIADLEQAYRAFAESVERMEGAGSRLVTHADEMHFSGASYLVESGKPPTACPYPRLRQPEDAREAELGAYFNPLADEGWGVKRAYRAYQFDLTSLRDVLSTELTPRTIDAMAPIVRKAQADGVSLREALQRALAAAERAKTAAAQAPPVGG